MAKRPATVTTFYPGGPRPRRSPFDGLDAWAFVAIGIAAAWIVLAVNAGAIGRFIFGS